MVLYSLVSGKDDDGCYHGNIRQDKSGYVYVHYYSHQPFLLFLYDKKLGIINKQTIIKYKSAYIEQVKSINFEVM